MWKSLCFVLCWPVLFTSCGSKKSAAHFDVIHAEKTGINFTNLLKSTDSLNMFSYMYFYNGAGVGAGDFNKDGNIDLFFAGNQERNRLYLNKGDFKFEDVTESALIPDDKGWSTGVSVIDINNDGLLDLYICRVATLKGLAAGNQLLVCTGIKEGVPQYKEMAAAFGLDFKGLSTMAAFLDYDLDGDLDMFLMNHSLHHNGTFGERKTFLGTFHPVSGDRFYRNDGGKFTNITKESGINSSVIGYGLGIAVADINLDGYPDIYIGNDFHENDYLYINQQNGTFLDKATVQLQHTAQFSMGVDVADINNDALPEIVSMDMLPEDPYILKRSLGEDEYNISLLKIRYGYQPQYTRNNLQLNNGDSSFSEIGFYAGIYASDWSWAPLWFDFDNDGNKDLFISNGIPKRLNDIDYVNFISNDAMQSKIEKGSLKENDHAIIDQFPQIKLKNKFFRNTGELKFDDLTDSISDNPASFSNGAVYADLDNDGDLDVVVNNINESPVIYRNTHARKSNEQTYTIKLTGSADNINALGAKIVVFSNQVVFSFEKHPVHGFQSSMEQDLHVAIGAAKPDSAWLIWPDQHFQKILFPIDSNHCSFSWQEGLPKLKPGQFPAKQPPGFSGLTDVTKTTNIEFAHRENPYIEFNRDPLIPHTFTTEGPALAVCDIDGDQLEDFFIGGARNQSGQVFLQQASGKFQPISVPALTQDSSFEDVAASFADINKDGFPDLLVASGGNEFGIVSQMNQPRLYLNDGKGGFIRVPSAFDSVILTASCIMASDINNDGYPDLFIGGRTVPSDYGKIPHSFLLLNNQKNGFTDVTFQWAPDLTSAGFITDAKWSDINADGREDLVLAAEWGSVTAYINVGGKFEKMDIGSEKGWWTSVYIADINKDGLPDVLAGNQGLNSRLKASIDKPVRMYYGDFDKNGKTEQVLTYYIGKKEVLLASKMEIEKQLPFLKKKFLYAADFAKASLSELIGEGNLEKATVFTADNFSNTVYLNKGNGVFESVKMPAQLQHFPIYSFCTLDVGGNGSPVVMAGGNFFGSTIEMGRQDAGRLMLFQLQKGNSWKVENNKPANISGQIREILPIMIGGKKSFILARNNDKCIILQRPD